MQRPTTPTRLLQLSLFLLLACPLVHAEMAAQLSLRVDERAGEQQEERELEQTAQGSRTLHSGSFRACDTATSDAFSKRRAGHEYLLVRGRWVVWVGVGESPAIVDDLRVESCG